MNEIWVFIETLWYELIALLTAPFIVIAEVLGFGETPRAISELKVWELAIAVGIVFLAYLGIKAVLRSVKEGGTVVAKTFRIIYKSPKVRASKLVCLHCGRTLDKCVCADMKDLSLRQRIRKHMKEVRHIAKSRKIAAKNNKNK